MRIASVRIQNLRSFKDQAIPFDPYTCLVGPNGAGKSNVFCAMNIFFREDDHSPTDFVALEEEDFHNRDTGNPIRITVTFVDLSPAAKADLQAYVRHDQLVVTAVAEWDPEKRQAPVRQVGERHVMNAFSPYFEADKAGAKASELKAIFTSLRGEFPEVKGASTKDDMKAALREYEEAHSELCELVESPDQFYGVSKGDHLLNRYIQWVFVPAVKDAFTEHREARDSVLGKLLSRTVRTRVSFKEKLAEIRDEAIAKYQAVLDESQGALNDISAKLTAGVTQWATPDTGMDLVWHGDKEKNIQVAEPFAKIVASDGGFSGAITRFGHGLQRSYLLALLQLIASGDTEEEVPTLILACEEPELFQHPPQARHLSEVFYQLSEKGNQVAVCTHSPLFVRGESFEHVRLIRRDPATRASIVSHSTATDVEGDIRAAHGNAPIQRKPAIAKLDQELNPELNELFFAPYVVLVEGREDLAYLKAHLIRLGLMERFRTLGCHIIPTHRKSQLPRPLTVLRRMHIPHYCLFDADGDCKPQQRDSHQADNNVLLKLLGSPHVEPFPSETYWGPGFTVWPTCLTKIVQADFGLAWEECLQQVRNEFGHPPAIEKTSHFIPEFLDVAWERGLSSPTLEQLCQTILRDAEEKLVGGTVPGSSRHLSRLGDASQQ